MTIRNWTPAALAKRKADNAKLRQRVIAKPSGRRGGKCYVPDCGKPSGDATPGLLGRYCKKHLSQYLRHGSPLRLSYTGPEVNRSIRAALSFIERNADTDYLVGVALAHVADRYRTAGPEIEPRSFRGTTPEQKANALWARLRNNQVPPSYVLATIAGVQLVFDADPQAPSGARGKEFRHVQIAKALLRLAGGEVKYWGRREVLADPITGRTERPPPETLRVFPYSTGRALRIIGREAEKVADVVTWHKLPMAELAASLPMTAALRKSPWPNGRPAKRKPRVPDAVKPTGAYAAREEAKKQRRKALDKARKDAAAATIATPEQEALRRPRVKALRNGVWVEE